MELQSSWMKKPVYTCMKMLFIKGLLWTHPKDSGQFVYFIDIYNLQIITILDIYIYYIHTEKYSPKSYVVNFRTQISSSQSEERTMVFTREKNDTSNQNRERCFFKCEKNDTSNQKPQRCVSVAPKFPPFLAACWAPLRTHSTRKVLLKEFFVTKKVKNISEMEWNSFVCFTVDKENGREPAKQQRKGINRTRRKLLLCFLSELLCLSFKLKLILKPAILLKFTHFQLCIENKQLRLLVVLGLPHILTII